MILRHLTHGLDINKSQGQKNKENGAHHTNPMSFYFNVKFRLIKFRLRPREYVMFM